MKVFAVAYLKNAMLFAGFFACMVNSCNIASESIYSEDRVH